MKNFRLSPEFLAAVAIAPEVIPGCYKRASINGKPVNYSLYRNSADVCFVVGDTIEDIPSPDCFVSGMNNKPAIIISFN
jgi:hypothetical protein